MTTINHTIRQTSMFTMNGLVDPRIAEPVTSAQSAGVEFDWKEMFSITSFLEALAFRKTSFR